MRKLVVALAAAAPLVALAQTQAGAPEGAPAPAPQDQPAPSAGTQPAPAPQGQYAPPPQYPPPPQGQYAAPPQYPPPQGQYAAPPQYPPPPQGQYPAPPQYQYPPGYPPPPQYAPPGYPPPAPAPRPYQRDSWYIGFGIGGGDGRVKDDSGTYTFKEYLGKSPTTVALNFKVGATLTPRLLFGFDLTGIVSEATEGDASATVDIVNYDALVTFFPWERGFFVRGGVGLSVLTQDVSNMPLTTGGTFSHSKDYSGGNVTLGVGYAWWLGTHFNLCANLDFSGQSWGGSEDPVFAKPKSSSFWALGLGFDWY